MAKIKKMTMSLFLYMTLLTLLGCAGQQLVLPLPPVEKLNGMKTPVLILPDPPGKGMEVAASAFARYANSDEFYSYAKTRIDNLDGGNEANVDMAIKKFRSCLNDLQPVHIVWKKYYN